MALMTSIMDNNKVLTISIKGRFDYHSVTKFRYQYEILSQRPKRYIIDLTETTAMDSTALGLLLHLKNLVGSDVKVTLKQPNESIAKVLKISQLDRLFHIDQ